MRKNQDNKTQKKIQKDKIELIYENEINKKNINEKCKINKRKEHFQE